MSFWQSIQCHIFCIFVLFVGDFAVKRAPMHSAEVPSSVLEHKKAMMCLMEKSVS